MSRRSTRVAPVLAVVVGLLGTGPVQAVAPTIHDGGEFFSADAVKKANEQIRELYRKYERDLLIETYKTLPAADAEKLKGMSPQEREKFYEKWAKERHEALAVHGIYILVTRQPSFLQIEVTPRFRSVVDDQALGRLRNMLLNDFREKQYDAALDEAVKFLRLKLEDAAKK